MQQVETDPSLGFDDSLPEDDILARYPRFVHPHRHLEVEVDVLFFHGSLVHGSRANRSPHRFRRSLIFHYIPQASIEVAKFYLPLITSAGDEVLMAASAEGGPCGEGWINAGH
jgi:ectoine hydroxylase-related dioxygenase (phytanoyl-CoA dioxygenase family)